MAVDVTKQTGYVAFLSDKDTRVTVPKLTGYVAYGIPIIQKIRRIIVNTM